MGGVSDANYFRGLKVEWNLADTKAVVQELQGQYPTVSHAKRPVIAFGGSYSGATCAWFRQSHPDVVDACVSASGVVNAILDFPQFDEHVSGAIGTTCANAMSAAYAAVDRAFVAGDGNSVKILFNASNLIGTTMGDSDFMFAIADGPAMIDQYGGKKDLCEGFAKLPPNPTDEKRIENLASIIDAQYGAAFSADCFYDSECFKNTTAGGGPSQLGGLNSRSWRFQTCSEVAYLQTRPIGSTLPPLRSTKLTIAELQRQCRYVFGDKIEAVLAERNAHLNAVFGQSDPTKGSAPGASNIFYLDYSDDPWAEASVNTETAPTLPYCMTTCDGCGHCGAGVPASLHECSDRADAFVDHVLAAHAAKAKATTAAAAAAAVREATFMAEYWRFHNTSYTRWVGTVPRRQGAHHNGVINWVERGAVTHPISQGRCGTCQAFACIADVEGAWFLSGQPLTKLSEQQIIDCGGGDAYGMKWIVANGGVASVEDAPLANHSDPNITGCRGITDCVAVAPKHGAYINGSTCLSNHDESNILALLQYGPMSVSIKAEPLNGYQGGVIQCTGDGIDHAVALVGYGVDKTTLQNYWTIKNSWGDDFGESSPPGKTGKGEKGYARLQFGNSCLRGPCQAFVGHAPPWQQSGR